MGIFGRNERGIRGAGRRGTSSRPSRASLAVLALSVGVLGVAGSLVASASAPPPLPTLTFPPAQGFVVGGQIGTSDINAEEPSIAASTFGIPMHMTWTATGSPNMFFDLVPTERADCSDADFTTTIDADTTTPSYDVKMSDYVTGPCAFGNPIVGYTVIATDPEGALVGKLGVDNPTVYQQDGRSPVDRNAAPVTVTSSGTWSTGTCTCASGGTQRFTSQAGASVSFTRSYEAGSHFALVMAKGPGRGSAAVYVDGTQVGTVNTNAAGANQNRIIVLDRVMAGGQHTIKVVNKATAGHPRIDVDAFLVS